jgi:hypothetical protein
LTTAGIQTGVIASQSPPAAPSFKSGGISNDDTIARVNRREMLLNTDQQTNLFDALSGVGNRGRQDIYLQVDGRVLQHWIIDNQYREALEV